MKTFTRSVLAVVAAVGLVTILAPPARAEETNKPIVTPGESGSAYVAQARQPPPGARVESVLTDPSGAVAGTTQGSGWVLHYGTERDQCMREDATPGLRMMCVAW